jgi:hypothetical protein
MREDTKKPSSYNPKTKADFEAYCRAMDAANEDVIKGAEKRTAQKKATKASSGSKK